MFTRKKYVQALQCNLTEFSTPTDGNRGLGIGGVAYLVLFATLVIWSLCVQRQEADWYVGGKDASNISFSPTILCPLLKLMPQDALLLIHFLLCSAWTDLRLLTVWKGGNALTF